MKNTSGVSLAAGGSTPNERFQIANIISFAQSRVFDPPCVFDAGNEGGCNGKPVRAGQNLGRGVAKRNP